MLTIPPEIFRRIDDGGQNANSESMGRDGFRLVALIHFVTFGLNYPLISVSPLNDDTQDELQYQHLSQQYVNDPNNSCVCDHNFVHI